MLLSAAVVGAGCARRGTPPPDGASRPAAEVPRLFRLVPDSADLSLGQVVQVLAIGRHFDPIDNVVEFGPVPLRRVAANATGDTLAFTVPLERPGGGGAPPRRLDPDRYDVCIVTAAGRTNPLPFRVVGHADPARPSDSSGPRR
jgi:hypothetical protein